MKKFIAIILVISCFNVTAQVNITDFSPKSDIPGSAITLMGSGFGATIAENIVYFGSVRANVLNASPTSLTVETPRGS